MSSTVEIAGVEVPRADKVLFPDDGFTKRDLAGYYRDVAPVMVPQLTRRPVNMQRFPDGIASQGFYEKKLPDHFPDWVSSLQVDTADGPQRQVVVDDERSLVYLAGQACVTPHTWLSRAEQLDKPDQLVFDLDPSTEDLARLRKAVRATRDLLTDLGLDPFLKTTGSRGYHVHVPLEPVLDFDTVREFARSVGVRLADQHPKLFTVEQRKNKRGDAIYVDVMRNAYGQTAVPAYAVRARPGAPVSTPIDWDELSRVTPDRYTIRTVGRRLAQRADPWKDMASRAQRIDKAADLL